MENLLNLPVSTIVDKTVPKNAFWGRDSSIRNILTYEFDSIIWLYKLTPATLNVEKGNNVDEIDIFYCKMKNDNYDINIFRNIDTLLPRQTLFIIEHNNKLDLLIHHKEMTIVKGEQKWICSSPEIKQCIEKESYCLQIIGHTMDTVYSGLLNQISSLNIRTEDEYKLKKANIEVITNLKKQISILESKARKEVQYRKKFELHQKILVLQNELDALKNCDIN